MPWGRRRSDCARLEIEDGMQAIKNIVLAGEFTGIVQGQVGAWVRVTKRSVSERNKQY